YLWQAGTRAARRSALSEARAWLERSLQCLEALPETDATLADGVDLRLELQTVLVQLGEFPGAVVCLEEAQTLADRLDGDARRRRVHAFPARALARMEEPDRAIANGQRALAIAERLGDRDLQLLTMPVLALAHQYRGEYARAVELTTSNLAALSADRAHEFFGSSQPASVNSYFRLIAQPGPHGPVQRGDLARGGDHPARRGHRPSLCGGPGLPRRL